MNFVYKIIKLGFKNTSDLGSVREGVSAYPTVTIKIPWRHINIKWSFVHDGELSVKGDNMSFANLEEDDVTMNALKRILSQEPDNSAMSYNFGQQIAFMEIKTLIFQRCLQK